MKRNHRFIRALGIVITAAALSSASSSAFAHCDGVDGPVAGAARRALDTGDAKHVLIWVQKDRSAEVTAAFEETMAARKAGGAARQLADRYFTETVVRVHRAGEGEPYTGLKPAGRDLGPAIPAADHALAHGTAEPVAHLVTEAVNAGVRDRFGDVAAKAQFDPKDVEAGRRYVAAYVDYLHYVERLYDAAKSAGAEHQAAASEHAH